MAFIEKAGQVLGQLFTETVEDPKELQRGLELLVRGATLPDADESTGDFRQSAYDLGRFRQETRRREQEDLAAAKAAEAEAKRQQELERRQFEIAELDRELGFKKGIADTQEQQAKRRHKERMDSAKRTQTAKITEDSKKEFFKILQNKEFHPSLLFTARGTLNDYGMGLAVSGKLENILKDKKLMKKLYQQKMTEHQAHINSLNKGTEIDRSDHVNYAGSMLTTMNNSLPKGNQVNTFMHKHNFAKVDNNNNRVSVLMNAAGNEYLSSFSTLTSRYFLTMAPKNIAKDFGIQESELRSNLDGYKRAIQQVEMRGPLAPAPGFDDFLDTTLIPVMKKRGADEFFRKAFQVKKSGTVIEGNEDSPASQADYVTRTFDLSFLRDDPIMTKVAIKLGAITKEEVQAIVSSLPAKGNTATTISTPADNPKLNVPATASPSRPRATTTVKVQHNKNHFPGEVVSEIRQFHNNINAIEDETDRSRVKQTLKYARENYMGLTNLDKYNLYQTVFQVMERNRKDFLAPEASINPYTIYALSLIDSTATKYTEVRGGQLVEVTLTRNSQRPRYRVKDGKTTQELTDEFKRRGKAQSQRQEIDLQLLGMIRLNNMTADQFGELDYSDTLKGLMGTAAEVQTGIEGLIGTVRDVVKKFFGRSSGDIPFVRMGSSMEAFDDLENNSMYGEGSKGITTLNQKPVSFANKYGFEWSMNGTNMDRMKGLRQLAQDEATKIALDFRDNMTTVNDAGERVVNQNISQDEAKKYYTNYLKRTALLWEKTALTYRLAGYVQGDQTGGRTISNQDFDNVYHALWGGRFFTEYGARNALRYLKFKNDEALQRGVGEDFLVQARGQTFTSNDRHINAVRTINEEKMDRFYRNAEQNGPEVRSYMEDATYRRSADSKRASSDLRALTDMRNTEIGKKFQGIPENTEKNAVRLREMSKHIEFAHDMVDTLDTFEENKNRKGSAYQPDLKQVNVYKSMYTAIENRQNNPFGRFLTNNLYNYTMASKAGRGQDFPEMLKSIAVYTEEVLRVRRLVRANEFQAKQGEVSSVEGLNMLQLFSSPIKTD